MDRSPHSLQTLSLPRPLTKRSWAQPHSQLIPAQPHCHAKHLFDASDLMSALVFIHASAGENT